MENTKKYILIPWDFTQKAENALEHAIRIAKVNNHSICLLHIVEAGVFSSSSKKAKQIEEATKALEDIAEVSQSKHQVSFTSMVKEGSIFTTISEVAEEIGATLAVMGTHGIKGTQKVFGSWALKVIASSKVPFLVIQAPPTEDRYHKILIPIDFRQETKEKLLWANYLAHYYESKAIIFYQEYTDENIKKKVNANLNFAKKYFEEKDIEYELAVAKGRGSFSDTVIDFAKEIEASVILIMTTKDIGLSDYMFGADEQQIIANEAQIPVMCVNPRTDLKIFQGYN